MFILRVLPLHFKMFQYGTIFRIITNVVKMRKDVKKARVLTIRRLTRHIGKLKLKRALEIKNQKRVERLIEEIHAMKVMPCLDISILETIIFSN
uniref:Uncharacterized protein n=1 Tax=Malurus cyaneus samueli TaxID=2593467 RepID=A0A8C5U2V8_9PASS